MRELQDNVHIFNFTLLTSLVPDLKSVQHDNQDGVNLPLVIFDDDRILTLTHCRYDAKVRFGISRVIVIDFDEFLYCRAASSSHAMIQSLYFHHFLEVIERQGYHQMSLQQRIIASKDVANLVSKAVSSSSTTSNTKGSSGKASYNHIKSNVSMVECINQQVQATGTSGTTGGGTDGMAEGDTSLFDCLTTYPVSFHQGHHKSISMNNPCLLTHFHRACPTHVKEVRTVDCMCTSTTIDEHCVFIHIGFRNKFYNSLHKFPSGSLISSDAKQSSELKAISRSSANN
jgi:hypothetical protein